MENSSRLRRNEAVANDDKMTTMDGPRRVADADENTLPRPVPATDKRPSVHGRDVSSDAGRPAGRSANLLFSGKRMITSRMQWTRMFAIARSVVGLYYTHRLSIFIR